MRNTIEVQAILTSIYCINFCNENSDNDINKIIDYAFRRFFGANTNLISLCCIGKSKEQIMPEIMKILENDTQYQGYLDEYKSKEDTQNENL